MPAQTIDIALLRRFAPLNRAGRDSLAMLARHAQRVALPPDTTFVRIDETDPWSYFLLRGEVELKAKDGRSRAVQASSASAHAALAQLKPRQYEVISRGPVELLKVKDELVARVLRHQADERDGIRLSEPIKRRDPVAMQRAALESDIRTALLDGTLALPALPEVAVRVRHAVEEPNMTAERLARLIELTPSIAARLVQMANSPLYRAAIPIDSLRNAVTRLGFDTSAQLVVSLSLRELFKSPHAGLRKRMVRLWRHSVNVGALSAVLARMTPGVDPESALLAGLLHDIGVIPVLDHLQGFPQLVADDTSIDASIHQLRSELGGGILQQWAFSEELVAVARDCEDWYRDPSERADLADVVMVAQLHQLASGEDAATASTEVPVLDAIPAFAKLAVGELTPARSIKALDEARQEVAAIGRLLG